MVYVFLANGFEEMEALAPVDLLRRAGVEVFTVGVGSDMIVSSHNIPVKTDTTVDKIVLNDELEMIVLPGGMPGTLKQALMCLVQLITVLIITDTLPQYVPLRP